jgi:PKD repeat protein
LSNDVTKIPHFKSILAPYGVKNIYYYGPDEAPMNRTMVQNVLNAGGSYFDTVPSDQAAAAADILPLEVYSVPPDPTIAATYHSYGHRIYSYFNPQSVPEFPRTMRLNYGLLLWQNNFDGAMTYAYQDGAGSIWNDFDAADTFRDHNFAYPTVNGVIDTVQWEGYRDGCTDRQYVKALQNAIASRPANPTSLLANNYLSGLKSTSLTATDLDSTVSTISNYAATIYASANSSNEVGIVTYQNNTSLNFSTTYNASYVKTINTTVSPIHNISSPANISGLVAWYKFDEASGTNIINYANSSNNGTLDGTTYTRVAGKYNNAVNFNGDGENRMSYNDPVLGKTAFTVIGWANKKGSSFYNFNNIIGDYGNTTNWMLIENPAGTADFYIGDGTVGSVKATTQGGWTNNSWHMISGRYSQASDLAITGVDLNFTSQVLDGYVTNIGTVQSDNCYVGFWHDNWQAFNGSLDQIMIYNRSLTDSEIQDIYYSQIANLTVKTNSNSTQSSKINGGGTTTVPFAHTDAGINALTFAVPSSVIINGTTINDYQNTVSPLLVNVSITNIDLAVASFTSNVTSGIAPLVVQFNDTSTGSQLSWNWYFGDGTSNATTQNVTHTYSTPGTYSVVLTTSNSIGKSTANTVITVNKITPTITWSNPANITYGTALSSTQQNAYVTGISGALSFSPAPGTILAAGNYNLTVTFTPSNLTLYSIVTKTVPLTVNKATPTIAWSNPANITYGTALSSTQLNAIASVPGNKTYTPPLNSIISIGTQNLHVDFTPTDSTNYTTASKDVTINVVDVGPIANFSLIPNSGNIPLTVAFTSTSTGYPTSYQWNFGDGTANDTTVSPTHVYNKCGIFNVTLTVSNTAGSNTKTVTSAVTVRPTANFTGTPTNGNTPLTVQFTDSSLGTPTSWNWNFGDGQSSNTSSPSHQYSSAGTYTVILTVTNAGGSDIITRSNYITASLSAPMAAFTASPLSGQSPLTVQFTDQSTNSPTSWNWDFGDGQTSSSQNPSHIYTVSTTTTFIVKLTATNAAGNNTLTKSSYITVSKGVVTPVANFTANVTTGLSPMNVKFTDQSTNSPTSWSWTFGDGNTSTSQNPTHLYVGNGLRTVSLTATNSNGSNTVTKTSYINVTSSLLKPVPKFTSDKRFGATPLTVNFTDQSTNSPNSWAWNFGDGTTNSTQNPSHVYSKTGIFSVSMVSANGAGTGNVFTKYSYIWVYPNWGIALTFPLFEGVPA